MNIAGFRENKRVWLGGGAVLAVVILVAGWFVVIDPQLAAASSSRDQTASTDQQNQALQQRNDDLKDKNGDQGALQAGLSAALAQLPADGALPAFTRQLSAQAKAAGVALTSVIVGAATPVAATGGQTAAAAAAPVAPTAGTTTAAVPPATSADLVQMTITVSATGSGSHDLAFLRAIQWNGPRRALLSAVQLIPTAGGTTTGGTTTGSTTTGSTTTGGKTTGGKTTGSKTTGSVQAGSAATGIDGQCILTMTMTIFSAPLSPSAQADLEKLLSGK